MKILIVGFGAIGRRHLHNLLQRTDCQVAVCRRSHQDAKKTHSEFSIEVFENLKASETWHPNCVIVCNPTSLHLKTAHWAVKQGCHVLIEKPISHTTEGVEKLLIEAQAKDLLVAVACNLRFHPALRIIKKTIDDGQIGSLLSVRAEVGTYLPNWHPNRDYRTEYSAQSDLGGGALLTLIHELDYVYWIAGDVRQAQGWKTHVSRLKIDVDDITELICRHLSGAISSIHMDFLDRSYNRRSRWVGEHGTLEWAWEGPVHLLSQKGKEKRLWYDPNFDLNQTYIDEIDDFFACIKSNQTPCTSGQEGKRVLEIAQKVKVI